MCNRPDMSTIGHSRLTFGLALTSVFFAAAAHPHQQPKQPAKAPQARQFELPKHSGPPPLAEFGVASTESPAEQLRRQNRESRSGGWGFFAPISDPGRVVDGLEETDGMTIIDYAGRFDPFPAADSAAIVLGTVIGARGFIRNDRTFVYSDYRIRVDEILKQDQAANIAAGTTIVASRIGATVRFPSGHIRRYFISGHGMPKVGAQYLLFLLRPDLSHPEYWICTGAAYELSDGKGFPLDDYQPSLEGIDVTELLARARKAIADSSK